MPRTRAALIGLTLASLLALVWWFGPRAPSQADPEPVIDQYVQIAHAVYTDSLLAARELQASIALLAANPSQQTLSDARTAWREARIPYMQSEVFRFGNPPVDAWEGQVNAWPLDEGLIDYTAGGYTFEQGNAAARANIIANTRLQIGGQTIDLSQITAQRLADLNEIGGSEANVATGYHAIEFLLWGQDLNGTGPGAGERPHTDFVRNQKNCTDGTQPAPVAHCQRRVEYLKAAAQLLITDLEYMAGLWAPDASGNYRARLTGEIDQVEALRRMLFGMGSLVLGELAGERMKVALIAHSTEDEHDCFSDNTHNSHYFDMLGVANVYRGDYRRRDGSLIDGPGIDDLLAAGHPEAAARLDASIENALQALNQFIVAAEEEGEHFDQLIAPGNTAGHERIQTAIGALVAVAQDIEQASGLLGIDNLQPDNAGHQF